MRYRLIAGILLLVGLFSSIVLMNYDRTVPPPENTLSFVAVFLLAISWTGMLALVVFLSE